MLLTEFFRSWRLKFAAVKKEIENLNALSENEFVDFGLELQEFYFKAKEIANTSSSVANHLAKDEIASATTGMQHLLDEMNQYLKHSEALSGDSEKALNKIQRNLEKITKTIEGFKKIVRTLYILGVSTRIENSSISSGESNFDILSEEVKNLAEVVDSKMAQIASQSGSLNQLVESTLAEVITGEGKQHEQARNILTQTTESLNALLNTQQKSKDTVIKVSEKSGQIYSKMGEVVSSMQFNDITRQQTEHIVEALDELTTDFAQVAHAEADSEKQSKVVHKVGNVCELQNAQIVLAKNCLNSAVAKIFDNLHGIAANTRDFITEMRCIGCSSEAGESSFLTEIGSGIDSMSRSLIERARANREMVDSVKAVTNTVMEMTQFLDDIEKISQEIEMIAVNATVKASNIGSQGAALIVLSRSIGDLSKKTHIEINIISDSLRDVSHEAKSLKDNIENNAKKQKTEIDTMIKEMHDLVNTLRVVDTETGASLAAIDVEANKLARDIEQGIAKFHSHDEFATVLSGVHAVLADVVADADRLVPGRRYAESGLSLEDIESRYTMESERKTLRAFADSETPVVNKIAEPECLTQADDDFGENIELF